MLGANLVKFRYEEEKLSKEENGWTFAFEWGALQPQRTRLIKPVLSIKAVRDVSIEFAAKVFADSFPKPILLKTSLEIGVNLISVKVADLIPNLEPFRIAAKKEYSTITKVIR